jgi:hypothetical protein
MTKKKAEKKLGPPTAEDIKVGTDALLYGPGNTTSVKKDATGAVERILKAVFERRDSHG